ncbi:hypothetical protein HN51_058686, partial [Arachis hypogaea]
DMVGVLAAIAEMKRRLAFQPPISVGGDGISSSATISRQPRPRVVEGSREGQGPRYSLWRRIPLPTLLSRNRPRDDNQDDAIVSIPPASKHVLD